MLKQKVKELTTSTQDEKSSVTGIAMKKVIPY